MTRNTYFCSRCVMNSHVDPDIHFVEGLCNHCLRYDKLVETRVVPIESRSQQLDSLVSTIKKSGRNSRYDCLVGVSGGVDSSYVALIVKELGLNPLAVHVDNGWNSSLAVKNIERILTELNIDLHTEVLKLDEFYDLQRSFLFGSTPDAEIPTDHAIQATLWRVARKHKIKFIISGMNFATESINVPSWSYGHSDWKYIKSIHNKFGLIPLKTYPHFGFMTLGWTALVSRVRSVSILNYLNYDKNDAIQILQKKLGWIAYPGKHYESIYTRWIQGYYLIAKFGIDKRFGHYSDLINSGQVTRAEAIAGLKHSDYSENQRKEDEIFLRKKLGLSEDQLNKILVAKPLNFHSYSNSYKFVQFLRRSVNVLRENGLYPK